MVCREVTHHEVVDLELAHDLVEGLGAALEDDEVVDALLFLLDLEGEPAPAPGVVAAPRAAGLLDELTDARDQLVLPLLGELRVQHEKNLVRRHKSR